MCAHRSGVNLWRDSQKPVEILQEYCLRNRLEGPVFLETTTVKVGEKTYKLTDFGKFDSFRISLLIDSLKIKNNKIEVIFKIYQKKNQEQYLVLYQVINLYSFK